MKLLGRRAATEAGFIRRRWIRSYKLVDKAWGSPTIAALGNRTFLIFKWRVGSTRLTVTIWEHGFYLILDLERIRHLQRVYPAMTSLGFLVSATISCWNTFPVARFNESISAFDRSVPLCSETLEKVSAFLVFGSRVRSSFFLNWRRSWNLMRLGRNLLVMKLSM